MCPPAPASGRAGKLRLERTSAEVFDPQFLLQLVVSGLVLGSRYALLAVSFGIIYSATQLFHMAHSIVYTVGAYAAVLIATKLGAPIWLALLAGLATAVVLGLIIEVGIYRPMRRRAATSFTLFLASLGLAIAGASAIQILFGPENQNIPRIPIQTIAFGRVTFTTLDMIEVALGWVAIAALLLFLRRTRYGRAILAIRSNPEIAITVGIPIGRVFLLIFAIGSFLAALSSLVFTLGSVAFPTMGLAPILISIIAVFLGGTDSIPGAALGGLILGLATSLSAIWSSGEFAPVVVFGTLFVVLVLRPQGLLGQAAVRAGG